MDTMWQIWVEALEELKFRISRKKSQKWEKILWNQYNKKVQIEDLPIEVEKSVKGLEYITQTRIFRKHTR